METLSNETGLSANRAHTAIACNAKPGGCPLHLPSSHGLSPRVSSYPVQCAYKMTTPDGTWQSRGFCPSSSDANRLVSFRGRRAMVSSLNRNLPCHIALLPQLAKHGQVRPWQIRKPHHLFRTEAHEPLSPSSPRG